MMTATSALRAAAATRAATRACDGDFAAGDVVKDVAGGAGGVGTENPCMAGITRK
jgi:hypothetical protein